MTLACEDARVTADDLTKGRLFLLMPGQRKAMLIRELSLNNRQLENVVSCIRHSYNKDLVLQRFFFKVVTWIC